MSKLSKADSVKRKTEKVLENNGNTPLAQLDATLELTDKIGDLTEAVQAIKIPEIPKQESMKMEILGVDVITIKGDKGDAGEKGEKGDIGDCMIGPQGNQGIQGMKGEPGNNGTDGSDGLPGEKGEKGEDGSPDTAQMVRDKLESLRDDERLDISAIKGIENLSTKQELDRAISILDQRTQYLINKPSTTGTATSGSGSVITDSTLKGNGTSGSVLGIDLTHANTWTGQQTFSAAAPIFSTMIAGSVFFAGTSGILSQNNTKFFWDNTNGFLGLGTNNPLAIMHAVNSVGDTTADNCARVETTAGTVGPSFRFKSFEGADYLMTATGSGNTGGAGAWRIFDFSALVNRIWIAGTTGNIGFGTSTPSAGLDIFRTTEQLRLSYDNTDYLSAIVSSTGNVSFSANGSATSFSFNAPVGIGSGVGNSTDYLQIRKDQATFTKIVLINANSSGSESFVIAGNSTQWNYGQVNTDGGLSITNDTGGSLTSNLRMYISATGDMKLPSVGGGIYIKEGTNATMGTSTLSGGTIVVSTTKVTANSRIFLSDQGGTITNLGSLYISARTAGTSFTVSSTNVLDASTFSWIIFEPV